MELEKVIQSLEAGNFQVVPISNCGCRFDWHIEEGDLVDGFEEDDCYEGFALMVDETLVAEHTRYSPLMLYVNGMSETNIPAEIQKAMRSPALQRWETGNPVVHEERRREALIAFLMKGEYELDRDDERYFANEYTVILRELPDGASVPVTREEAKAWADDFLYRGDSSAQAFVGFRLETNQ
ncbi:MAG: hypothetical protein HPY85_10750 [Anaerolineae bacterium]|nr:hypothetical protein [Anaerolineae bacterium]